MPVPNKYHKKGALSMSLASMACSLLRDTGLMYFNFLKGVFYREQGDILLTLPYGGFTLNYTSWRSPVPLDYGYFQHYNVYTPIPKDVCQDYPYTIPDYYNVIDISGGMEEYLSSLSAKNRSEIRGMVKRRKTSRSISSITLSELMSMIDNFPDTPTDVGEYFDNFDTTKSVLCFAAHIANLGTPVYRMDVTDEDGILLGSTVWTIVRDTFYRLIDIDLSDSIKSKDMTLHSLEMATELEGIKYYDMSNDWGDTGSRTGYKRMFYTGRAPVTLYFNSEEVRSRFIEDYTERSNSSGNTIAHELAWSLT